MTLDAKLRWKEHVKKKREAAGLKLKKMWLSLIHISFTYINNKMAKLTKLFKNTDI